jgi:hypothetical protein
VEIPFAGNPFQCAINFETRLTACFATYIRPDFCGFFQTDFIESVACQFDHGETTSLRLTIERRVEAKLNDHFPSQFLAPPMVPHPAAALCLGARLENVCDCHA